MRMNTGKRWNAPTQGSCTITKNKLALYGQGCANIVRNPWEYLQPEGSGRRAGHCHFPPRSICPHNLPPPARTDGLCNVPYHRQPICGSPTTKEKSVKAKQMNTWFSLTNKGRRELPKYNECHKPSQWTKQCLFGITTGTHEVFFVDQNPAMWFFIQQ